MDGRYNMIHILNPQHSAISPNGIKTAEAEDPLASKSHQLPNLDSRPTRTHNKWSRLQNQQIIYFFVNIHLYKSVVYKITKYIQID